jgi:type VI secretion system protein ImpL
MIRRFFRALWNALKTPWVLSLVCALLLVLALWVIGPLVAVADVVVLESLTARLTATLIVVFAWGLAVAVFSSRQRKKELADPEIAARREKEAMGRDRFREEVAHLRTILKNAVKVVTTSNFYGPTSRSRYTLPWYMVLGPKDCGKTSLLLNSGLQFPLNEQADRHLYKLNSTDRCEILYANQAVFVDTPGNYAESNPQSRANDLWTILLRRLFRVRPAKALNGIIVCISMRDMLDGDSARREHLARTIRTRLGEVLSNLRAYIPVYLVFTKCDAVPGFAQFFAHLSRAEREQIFGSSAEADTTRKELRELMQTLNAQIISKIHQERDPLARGEMFRFPQELAALGPRLEDFIFEAFGPSRYHRPVMFRGFFFSSALTSNDIMAATARDGELPFQSGFQPSRGDYAKGFFLLRLLEDCIIPEAGLAGADREHIWRLRLRRFGPQMLATLALGGAVAMLSLSFGNNFKRLEMMEAFLQDFSATQNLHRQAGDATGVLPELSILEKAMDVFNDRKDSPVALGLGLYQGKTLTPSARAAYLNTLNTRLLPLVRKMAAQRIESSLQNIGTLKDALRAYLMLCEPHRVNGTFLREWLERQWSSLYLGRAEEQHDLLRHMDYLLAHGMAPAEPDVRVLGKAQAALLKTPLAQLAYQQMREEASESGRSPFTFHAALEGHMSPFRGDTYPVPYLYTKAGFEEYCIDRCPDIVRALTEDNWIFGSKPPSLSAFDIEKISRDVRTMYFRDFTAHWNQALSELQVDKPSGIAAAGKLAEQLTSGMTPVVLVLRELRKNITLEIPEEERGPLESAVEDQLAKKATQKLTGVAGGPVAKATTESMRDSVAEARAKALKDARRDAHLVRLNFRHLDGLLDAEGNPAPALKAAHDATLNAGAFFRRLADSENRDSLVLATLKEMAEDKNDTLRALAGATERLPAPVSAWYSGIATGGLQGMFGMAASIINTAYKESVFNVYSGRFKDHYPFNPASDTDADLEDFAKFFKDDGILDTFHEKYLGPFMTKNGTPRSIMGNTLPISEVSMAQLHRANRVKEAFFVSSNDLGIRFLLEPHALDVTLKQADLTYGDKSLSYWHGPVLGASFTWPLDAGQSTEASFAMVDINAVKTSKSTRGDWAIFRLLQGGKIKGQEGNTCFIEMYHNGRWAQYLMQFRNKANPFDPSVCSFSLPETLL